MNKLLIALVAGTFAATAWGQGAAPAPAATPAPAAVAQTAPPAKTADATKADKTKKSAHKHKHSKKTIKTTAKPADDSAKTAKP